MQWMCCFSRPVISVSRTRIFARPTDEARQLLVYGMTFEARQDLAMILPIPVPAGGADDAVRFVDMSACPSFLDDLSALFPVPRSFGPAEHAAGSAPRAAMLVVHDVGDFEASFVSTPGDFDRLDPRFRLPDAFWESLPRYCDWGFCVFKLKRLRSSASGSGLFGLFKSGPSAASGARKVHPMAFEFPRRDPSALFFPTVHVHDREVHPTAEFDHDLFCQVDPALQPLMDWERSPFTAAALPERAHAWVDPGSWLFRRTLTGELPNRDTHLTESKLRARTHVGDHFRLRMRAAWEHVVDDGSTVLDAQTKKWKRVSEAERMRIRDAVAADLAQTFADKKEEWMLAPFVDQGSHRAFFASSERIEPQQLDLVFAGIPPTAVVEAVGEAFQSAIERASR